MLVKQKFMLFIIFVLILIGCDKKGTQIIVPVQRHIPQGTIQLPKETQVIYKIDEKMKKVKSGEWIRENKLNVLCATGNAACSDGGQPLCYTGVTDEDLIEDNFADIAESSIPVCVTGNTVSYLIPSCGGKTLPVCGLPISAQETIRSSSVVCDSSKLPGVVCPFGGRPVCIEDVNLIFHGAYCVNSNNIIISGKPESGDPLYTIACKDESYTPECFFEYL